MTMGPPSGRGRAAGDARARRRPAIHLSDPAFAVADTLGTSRTLVAGAAQGGRRRPRPDGPQDGRLRDVAGAAGGGGVPRLAAGRERARRSAAWTDGSASRARLDGGQEEIEAELPAVGLGRTGSRRARGRAARTAAIDVWTAADLVDDLTENDKRFGQPGSPTRVLAVRDAKPERAGPARRDLGGGGRRGGGAPRRADRAAVASWEKPPHAAEKPAARYDAWSVVETREGRPTRPSLELVAKARELSGKLGGRSAALLAGHGLDEAAKDSIRHGAEAAYVVDDESLADFDAARIAGGAAHGRRARAAARPAHPGQRPRPRLRPAAGRRARGRHDRRLRQRRHRQGRPPAADEARLRREHRLGDHRRDQPAAGDRALPDVRAARAARGRGRDPSRRPRRRAGPRGRGCSSAARRPTHGSSTRPTSSSCWGPSGGPPERGRRRSPARRARRSGRHASSARPARVPWSHHVGLYGRPVAPRVLIALGVPGDFEHLTGFVKADVVVALPEASWPADVARRGRTGASCRTGEPHRRAALAVTVRRHGRGRPAGARCHPRSCSRTTTKASSPRSAS